MAEPQSTPGRVRPSSVTISSYLLILVAAIQVINLILTFATIGDIRRVLEDAYRDTSVDGVDAIAGLTFVVTIVVSLVTLLLAVALVVLALLNNRGKNAARITTWIFGGILLCCTGGSLLGGFAGSFAGPVGGTNADMPSQEEIQRRIDEALPSWYTPVSTLLSLVAALGLLAALILLALPASNEFFRKPQPVWEPPPPGAYPGYPQAGQYGYPQSGQPGYPPPGPGYPPPYGHPPAGGPPPSESGPQFPPPGSPSTPPNPPEDRPGQSPPSGS